MECIHFISVKPLPIIYEISQPPWTVESKEGRVEITYKFIGLSLAQQYPKTNLIASILKFRFIRYSLSNLYAVENVFYIHA